MGLGSTAAPAADDEDSEFSDCEVEMLPLSASLRSLPAPVLACCLYCCLALVSICKMSVLLAPDSALLLGSGTLAALASRLGSVLMSSSCFEDVLGKS